MRIYKYLVLTVLCVAGISCANNDKPEKASSPPNIIFILADDMGYGDVEAFNPACKIKTPHLNQLAADGMKFTDAHSTSAVCTPTRYGIITGRYAWRSRLKNGVLTGKSKALIPKDRTTIASMLKENGYHTAFIGKWHLGWDWALKDSSEFGGDGWSAGDSDNILFDKPVTHNPNDLGFDYAYGHSGSLDMAPYVYVENGKVTALPDRITIDTAKYTWWREGPTGADFDHEDVTPNFFRKALSYIDSRKDAQKPFFLYLPLPSPHTPILPTEEWLGKSLNPYADFVEMIDDYIGQMVKLTQDLGMEENTLIMFGTDNGCSPEADFELLAQQGHDPSHVYRGHKADIYEGGHRIPFIAKWPKVISAGSSNANLLSTSDLMATAADLAGYDLQDNEGEDSYSLLPLFKNESSADGIRKSIIHHSINGSFAIRQDQWKLIMCPGSGGWSFPRPNNKEVIDTLPPYQLYDLNNDPGETKNLFATNPDKFEELKALLTTHILNGRSTPGLKQSNDAIEGEWEQVAFIGSQVD